MGAHAYTHAHAHTHMRKIKGLGRLFSQEDACCANTKTYMKSKALQHKPSTAVPDAFPELVGQRKEDPLASFTGQSVWPN